MWIQLIGALALAVAPPANNPRAELAKIDHVAFPAPHRISTGAIDQSDIAALKRAGVGEVINLRADSESPHFDEASAVRDAGMRYRHLPIHGPQGLTRANVQRFDELLRSAGDRLTLVHCSSGNRVGAMIALREAWILHSSPQAALAEGRRWGLKGLEPEVRRKLGLHPAE